MTSHQVDVREDAIADFRSTLELYTTQTPPPPLTCGRSYVRVSKLVQWLESETILRGDTTTQATRLIDYAYHNWNRGSRTSWSMLPIDRGKLFEEGNSCIIIFSILLHIGWGQLVHVFRSMQITDTNLPIDLFQLKATFKEIVGRGGILPANHPTHNDLADLFNVAQWPFCPAKFNEDYEDYYDKHWIIPIHKRALISDKGGTAVLWQIEVLEEFVGKKLRQVVPTALYDDERDDLGPRYHFALKVFHPGNKGICDNERDAFNALHDHGGMVRYLGGYTHQTPQQPAGHTEDGLQEKKYTENILLEYGDRDLGLLFAEKLPPILQDDIQVFWQNLFAVADAVESIHGFKKYNDGIVQELSGWHADIKPDNILEIQGKFKLADPGFAKFLERVEGKSGTDPMADLSGGTHTFGCVFSIAATWVAVGAEGIKQYQRLRLKAIEKLVQTQDSLPSPSTAPLRLDRGDYFHDGITVLSEVTQWHVYLRNSLRITDKITGRVLDLLDKENGMLVGDPKLRMKSPEVCRHLKLMVKGLETPSTNVSTTILDFLRDGDDKMLSIESAPTSVQTVTDQKKSNITPNERQVRRDKFNEFLGAPLMANYRSYLKSTYLRPSFHPVIPPSISNARIEIPNASINTGFQQHERQPARYGDRVPRPGSVMTSVTGITEISTVTKTRKKDPQDVFQAREEMEINEIKRRGKSTFARFRSKPKDSTLGSYWGDRDLRFLVDNAESMQGHWGRVKYLLETLFLKALGLDPDGVDLDFTRGKTKARKVKDREEIVKKLNDLDARPKSKVYTAMQISLQQIFDDYFQQPLHGGKRTKLTVIVLTDGLWEGTLNKEDVNQTIIAFARKLENSLGGPPKDRPVSVEFIQFGKDPEVTLRLRRLDNELKYEGVIDLVDTEHCEGDVNKMLLGSFEEAYDEMEDEDESVDPISPSRQSIYSYDQFQGADHVQYTPPGALPRSQTMQSQFGPRDNHQTLGRDGRPIAGMHRPFNSQ